MEALEVNLERTGDGHTLVTDDFIKKLYNLLEDNSLSEIMCWGPQGDRFIIKDVVVFTADILPRVFRYSNFASFVRQLNKFDFHKIKWDNEDSLGDNNWQFRHQDFHKGGLAALERIRRKIPGTHNASQPADINDPATSSVLLGIQEQVARLAPQQDEMYTHIQSMENDYAIVRDGMADLQKSFMQRYDIMQQLMQHTTQMNNDGATQQSPG